MGKANNIISINEKQGIRSPSIQNRLLLLLLVVLIPVLLIQSLLYYDRFRARSNEEIQANIEIARAVGKTFEALISEILNNELIIGLAATATPPLSLHELNRILIRSTESNPVVSSFSWVSPQGLVLASSYTEWVGSQLADRPYFQKILAGRDWVVSDLLLSWANYGPLFTIVRTVRDDHGRLLGIVLAGVLPDKLDRIMAVKRSKGADISLFDPNGTLVYRYPAVQLAWEDRNRLDSDPLIRKALAGNSVAATIPASNHEQKRVMAYTPINPIGWVASAGRSEKEALKPIYSTLFRQGGLFLFVVFLSFIVALAISRDIRKPIIELREHALALGHRYGQQRIQLSGLRELEDLAHAFNFMSGQLHKWVRQAEQRAGEAEEGKRILDALMEHIPEGIAIASGPRAVIQKISTHGLELLGCSRESIQNKAFDDIDQKWVLWHADGKAEARKEELPLMQAIHNGRNLTNEEWLLETSESKKITILCNAGPIRNKRGEITGGIVTFKDINERKQAELALQKARDELEDKVLERTFELERRNKEFNEMAAKTIEAMENDRKSLAQELHDSIGGTLTAIMYQLEGRLSKMDPGAGCDEMPLGRILDHLKDAVHQTRRISKRLRPSILDDFGLVAAIKDTVGDFREFFSKTDVSLEFNILEKSIPDEMNIVLYRVVQEALNNVGKHSRANHVTIRLTEESKHIRLVIQDNGCGFNPQTITVQKNCLSGYGISSMKERVEICKGEFQIYAEIDKGAIITASFPLNLSP